MLVALGLTLAGVAVSVEHVPWGAEAAVGAREVEAVVEAEPGLGAGLEKLALVDICRVQRGWIGVTCPHRASSLLVPPVPWHTPPARIWKPVSQLQCREPGRPSAQRGWRLKEELLSVTQSVGRTWCHHQGRMGCMEQP